VIPLIIFYLHVVALTAVFTKRYQEESAGEGLLAVFFVALIFFIGWAMASFIMRLFMEPAGFGPWFNRDAASLVLLTLGECVFYYFYFKDEKENRETDQTPR
jgi:formate hydrogenlyase subunit 3/multisubunit Na+/H+ antiporter MnhD subunit